MAAGRCGETAANTWNTIKWDEELGIASISWRDVKSSKMKPVPILPSKEKHELDLYLSYADAATLGCFNEGGPSRDTTTPRLVFYGQFSTVSKAAPKVSKFLTDLSPGSSSVYSEYAVEGLSSDASSHGLRHGPVNKMENNGVASELVTDLTGHGATQGGPGQSSSSAFAFYHVASLARVVLGETICAA